MFTRHTALNNIFFKKKSNTINNLQIYYKFETADLVNGKILNYATNTYDATVYNGATINTSTFKVGSSSLYLNGSLSQYIQTSGFSVTNTGLSFSFWFNSSSTGWQRAFDFGSGAPGDNILYAPGNGTSLFIGTRDLGVYTGNGKGDNTWHHYVWTMSYATGVASTNIVYMDNVAINTATKEYPTLGTRTSCYIGKSLWTNDPNLTGYIDDFRVYNKVLTVTEIDQLYKLR